MTYEVQRLAAPMAMDANWDKPQWKAVEPIQLTYFMGDEPAHRPATQAKVLYDNEAIYVIFHVEDQYVRAVARQHQDMVCKDSCVEFFFTPGTDVSKGYFNLEMN
ncbi:MAG: carbohydrate-binding family 9-like protein, partial [Phycisphaerae bacterium]|nr:carbohydrate-binding family 9-like protein [Phycisphaerae bacterium]